MSIAIVVPSCFIGAIATFFAYRSLKHWSVRHTLPLPPGPKPLPIIGNLLDLPQEKDWMTYHAWCQQYGDVVFVEAFGRKILVLGSATAINDLLERRSTVYSSRPDSCMVNNLCVFSLIGSFSILLTGGVVGWI